MIDESTATTETPERWPLMLFLAPVAAILLSSSQPDAQWLATVAVGTIFVCGGLWSVWFGGYRRTSERVAVTFVGFISEGVLTWLSGFLLVASWGVVLPKFGEFWGVDQSGAGEEFRSLLPVLSGLSPATGLIALTIFVVSSWIATKWQPMLGEMPLWNKEEAPWVMTAVVLIGVFAVLAMFLNN